MKEPKKKTGREERLIKDLLKVKRGYDRYFKSLDRPDNQAVSSYTGVIKAIADLYKKIKPEDEAKDHAEWKRIADEIIEAEYGIKR